MEHKRLNDRVCLVTGASRGIGAAIAGELAELGARVAVHYGSSESKARAVAKSLPGRGHFVLQADLADPAAVPGLVDAVCDEAGRLDVLVNNAGIFEPHPPLSVDREAWLSAWRRTLDINLVAAAALCHAAAAVMAKAERGRIINIGSRGAFRGEPECPAYGASKAGLHAMSQSLAVALAPAGIQVMALAPGFVETDMAQPLLDSPAGDAIRAQSPMQRVATPAEVAATVAWLASGAADFLTGAIIDLNGASYLRT